MKYLLERRINGKREFFMHSRLTIFGHDGVWTEDPFKAKLYENPFDLARDARDCAIHPEPDTVFAISEKELCLSLNRKETYE